MCGCGVWDAGVGIDAVSMNKPAEAFYTTKSNGMGIEPAVGRSIIERHRGRLGAGAERWPRRHLLVLHLKRSRQRYGRVMVLRRL